MRIIKNNARIEDFCVVRDTNDDSDCTNVQILSELTGKMYRSVDELAEYVKKLPGDSWVCLVGNSGSYELGTYPSNTMRDPEIDNVCFDMTGYRLLKPRPTQ
jgi:hypothetical protein